MDEGGPCGLRNVHTFMYVYKQDHQGWGYNSTVERFEQREKRKRGELDLMFCSPASGPESGSLLVKVSWGT